MARPTASTDKRRPGHVVPAAERQPIHTEWSGPEDWLNAPPNYETFARQYLNYTREMCRRFGVLPLNIEDVVQEIITRFIERDSLAEFDPTFATVGVRKGTSDRASFRSYYTRFIKTYTMSRIRNSVRRARHELLILDAPLDENKTTLADLTAEQEHEGHSIDSDTEMGALFEQMSARDPRTRAALDTMLSLLLAGEPVRQYRSDSAWKAWDGARHEVEQVLARRGCRRVPARQTDRRVIELVARHPEGMLRSDIEPELSRSGVLPGQYSKVLARVRSRGRIHTHPSELGNRCRYYPGECWDGCAGAEVHRHDELLAGAA